MAGTVGNQSVAGLQQTLAQGLSQLNSMGLNVAGGGATPAAGATANPALASVANSQALAQGQTQTLAGTTADGRAVTLLKDKDGIKLQPATGRVETVKVAEGLTTKTLYFDAAGRNIRNFELADAKPVMVDLDRRQGIASGISNLSRVVAGRQERLKQLSEALAIDSNENGNTNQIDIQRLVQEQQVTEHLSNMNHKIYESVQNAIAPWLR